MPAIDLLRVESDAAERRAFADHVLAPVDPADVFCISGYVLNLSRGAMSIKNVFSVDDRLYANVCDGRRIRTYRWTITERQIGGADVETASLREVEWSHGTYEETGNAL